jgi:hypothetical protein
MLKMYDAQEMAMETLNQLGGALKLKTMIGAKYIHWDYEGAISFRFSGNRKINHVKINIESDDTYKFTFYKISKYDYSVTHEISGVYNSQLRYVFTEITGLDLLI